MSMLSRTLLAATLAGLSILAGGAHAQSAPDDAQIAGIVIAANQVDIDAGKLAQKMSKNAEVKAFAKQMVTDHSGVNKQAGALVKKLKVKPKDSDTTKSLTEAGEANIAKLKTMKGKDFDKAYIDHEVEYHQTVIDTVDKTLVPNAQNAELKDTLVKTRPLFMAHLEHAKQLQAAMK